MWHEGLLWVGWFFAFGGEDDDGFDSVPYLLDVSAGGLEAGDGVAGVDEGEEAGLDVLVVCLDGWWDYFV